MTQLDLAIRGGTIVTASDEFRADIGIRDGRIVSIADHVEGAAREIDATGLLALPGGIDSHVHITSQQGPSSRLDEVTQSSAEQALIGARYAKRTLLAGFTTVADLGADSLDTVELVMALEEEFETEIPDEEAEKITTVQAAVDYVKAHQA